MLTRRQLALEDAADVGPVELDLALEFAGLGNFDLVAVLDDQPEAHFLISPLRTISRPTTSILPSPRRGFSGRRPRPSGVSGRRRGFSGKLTGSRGGGFTLVVASGDLDRGGSGAVVSSRASPAGVVTCPQEWYHILC